MLTMLIYIICRNFFLHQAPEGKEVLLHPGVVGFVAPYHHADVFWAGR
jgi:hypothetical protein